MSKDIEKLAKLLAYTTSSNDHECLVAIRKANAMLAGRNTTWEMFLKGRYPKDAFSPQDNVENTHTDDNINEMFEVVFSSVSGTFREFLESIHKWWESKGFLTDKQYGALKNAFERADDRR